MRVHHNSAFLVSAARFLGDFILTWTALLCFVRLRHKHDVSSEQSMQCTSLFVAVSECPLVYYAHEPGQCTFMPQALQNKQDVPQFNFYFLSFL